MIAGYLKKVAINYLYTLWCPYASRGENQFNPIN